MPLTVDLPELRAHVRRLLSLGSFDAGRFLAAKLCALSDFAKQDVFLLAQALFRVGLFAKAVEILEAYGLVLSVSLKMSEPERLKRRKCVSRQSDGPCVRKADERACIQSNGSGSPNAGGMMDASESDDDEYTEYALLACQCFSKLGKLEEVCRVVDSVLGGKTAEEMMSEFVVDFKPKSEVSALLCLERGKALDSQENRAQALDWLKLAVHLDVRCMEALDRIVASQLTPAEEVKLLESLRRRGAFASKAKAWLDPVYECSLNKHDCSMSSDKKFSQLEAITASDLVATTVTGTPVSLADDVDVLALKAEARYYQHDARGAYDITRRIVESDRSNMRACLVHIGALVSLNKTSNLFYFAHLQMKERPGSALCWYSIGAYYYCSKQFEKAVLYMQKATNMEPGMLEAWIGLGHARAAAYDESDRGVATYRTAIRLFPGSHYPCLGICMEYLRTNKIELAEQFCRLALSLCDVDPTIHNEMGAVKFKAKRFDEAAQCFQRALDASRGLSDRASGLVYETTMFNLGHALRRAGRLQEAVQVYKTALSRCPRSASGHVALGLTYHMLRDPVSSIECYHVSLGIRPEDTIVNELLTMAMQDMALFVPARLD
jgi:anaphase-promoting complex subunit 6